MSVAAGAGSMRVAAVQTVSGGSVDANLAAVEPLIVAAREQGAKLVLLPEYFGIFGARATDKVDARETDGHGKQQDFLSRVAREQQLWLIGGTVPIATADPARVRSASLVFDPLGRRVARYDKVHLFAFSQGDERYDEAKTIEPGSAGVTFDSPVGRVGLSVCYDLRFPELYRGYRDVALIVVPSAFTAVTGAAHWHVLLKARAIENQCYVLAAAQGGTHANGRRTWGHSLIADPWGQVLAQRVAGEGVIVAPLSRDSLHALRRGFPVLDHRRLK